MKLLKLIALLFGCMLVWEWFDRCGSDVGFGEALPFCIDCSGFTTICRFIMLTLAGWMMYRIVQTPPDETEIYGDSTEEERTYLIHWHRIALLVSLLLYPLWVLWLDANTNIPGPECVPFFRLTCRYVGFKGTVLWGIALLFVGLGFRILHKD